MKRCAVLLIVREILIETIIYNAVSLHSSWTAIITKFTNNKCWRGLEKKESSHSVSGNVNSRNHYGEQYESIFKN